MELRNQHTRRKSEACARTPTYSTVLPFRLRYTGYERINSTRIVHLTVVLAHAKLLAVGTTYATAAGEDDSSGYGNGDGVWVTIYK